MGIDQGEVTSTADRYFGDALNIAARIQEKAPPGGVSVSGRVFEALDEPALRFRPVGRLALKNIPEPVDIFEFADLPGDGAAPPGASRLLSLAAPTLVVLPIHAETVGEKVRAIAEVIRSDLLHRLTTMSRLSVIDGEAVGPAGPAPAQYMVETGVHEVGDQVRVYAKVIHVATMNVVTSHKWATTVDGLFALTDTISDEIERGVAIEIVIGEQARLFSSIDDPEATQTIYQGWFQLTRDTYDGWLEAVKAFEEVSRSRPDLVYGYSLSAFANWWGASAGFADDPEAVLDKAFDQASIVLERGDPTGLAHMVQGAVLMARGRADEAVEVIEQAQITRPTCDVTYALEGSVRRYLGHWQKAVDLMDHAIRLSGPPGLVPDGAGLLAVHRWAARPGGGSPPRPCSRRARTTWRPCSCWRRSRPRWVSTAGPGQRPSRSATGSRRWTSTTGYAPTRSRTRSSSTGGGTTSPDWACSQERPAN